MIGLTPYQSSQSIAIAFCSNVSRSYKDERKSFALRKLQQNPEVSARTLRPR